MENSSDGQMSKFNAGLLQMKRIHDLQERINICNLNPLAYNEIYGVHNFEVILHSINSLYQEGRPKFKTDEIKEANQKIAIIRAFLKKQPVIVRKQQKVYPFRETQVVDYAAWEIIKDELFNYEKMIRKYLDKHKLNSPNEEGLEGL